MGIKRICKRKKEYSIGEQGGKCPLDTPERKIYI
jgi:hypothetical protein